MERNKQLRIELDIQDAEIREKEATDATLKALCPEWRVARIQHGAIKNVEKYLLEPRSYFAVDNTSDCQLDLPMIALDFLFISFQNIN